MTCNTLQIIHATVDNAPRVCILREEGSNGDREMAAAFHLAGFQVWDVNTQDLSNGAATLDQFQGLAFVGGFSYADVLGSAKGIDTITNIVVLHAHCKL